MAIFKFRKGGDDAVSAAAPLESVDAMRRRAMHRLIGAVVLVVAGVIGFPMLFDNQPRPIAVDIPIEIPDKAKSRPIVLPTAPPATQAAPVAAPAPAVAAKELPVEAKAVEKPVEKAVEKAAVPPVKKSSEPAKPVAPSVVTATPKPAPQPSSTSDAAKAQALLEGKLPASSDAAAPPAEGRFVVQVGAFADAAKAKEVRTKLERAGLKTYTQVVETKDGPRTRVRVGPFGDKAQAESSAEKIKALDLPASILVL
jgi:DedD protein